MDFILQGAGGKSTGGSTPSNVEDPNTLLATSNIQFVHLLCEGEIEGLVNGMRSVYINDTPLFTDKSGADSPIQFNCQWAPNDPSPSTYVIRLSVADINALSQIKAGMEVTGTGISADTFVRGVEMRKNVAEILLSRSPSVASSSSVALNFYPVSAASSIGANFSNFALSYRYGTQDQQPFAKFDSVESPLEGVTNTVEIEPGYPALVSVPADSYNGVKLTIYTGMMQESVINEKGAHTKGSAVEFAIDRKLTLSGDWTEVTQDSFVGKCTSPYVRNYRVEIPDPTQTYLIRVRRTTPLPTSSNITNKIYLQYAAGMRDLRLSYPNSALFAGIIDAKQFSSVPRMSYHLKLLKVRVPQNYDPITRAYSGIWNGAFKVAWTDNPAWCFYDLVTNERYGLGQYVKDDDCDKWTLYSIAQYCDELVSDGKGGQEPRFTCNLFLQEREEAIRVVANMASVFRGIAFWANGQMQCMQDRPADPVRTFTNANVKGGVFNYTGTPLKNRHTVALINWNDPDDFSKQKIEYVEDSEGIARFGVRQIDATAFACSSRGQAHRWGAHLLCSERTETEIVAFDCALEGATISPGEIFWVADKYRAGKRTGGRCTEISLSGMTMDAEFTFESGKTYSVILTKPDGKALAVDIVNPATTTCLVQFVIPAFPAPPPFTTVDDLPLVGSVFVLSILDELVPKQFRMIGAKEENGVSYTINGLEHNPNKYAFVEQGISLEAAPTSSFPSRGFTEPPTELTAKEQVVVVQEGVKREIHVSWTHSTHGLIKEYEVEYRTEDDSWRSAGKLNSTSLIIQVAVPAVYFVRVRAINLFGVPSVYATTATELSPDILPIPKIVGLELAGGGNSSIFSGHDVNINWRTTSPSTSDASIISGMRGPDMEYYTIEVYALREGKEPVALREDKVVFPTYYYTYDMNYADSNGDPARSLRFVVYGKDRLGRTSLPRSIEVSNPAPVLPLDGFRLSSKNGQKFLSFDSPADADYKGVAIFISTKTDFAQSDVILNGEVKSDALLPYTASDNKGMLLYDGPGPAIVFNLIPDVVYRVIYIPYDAFGYEGANVYGPVVVPVGQAEVSIDKEPPATPSTPTLSTSSEGLADGTTLAYITVTFARSTEADLALYGYKITPTVPNKGTEIVGTTPARVGVSSYVENAAGQVVFRVQVLPATAYSVTVWAIDQVSNRSAETPAVVITSASDSAAPVSPDVVTVKSTSAELHVSWSRSGEKDLAGYELFYTSDSSFTPSASTSGQFKGDFNQVTIRAGETAWNIFIGSTLYVYVRSYDRTGNVSAWSAKKSSTIVALSSDQIEKLAAAKIDGKLTSDQIASLSAAKLTDQLALSLFPDNARPIEVVSSLPSTSLFQGRVVLLTTDSKVYRHNGSNWTTAVDGSDLLANSVTGNSIAAKTITGDNVAANTFTAQHVVISNKSSLLPDPGFYAPTVWGIDPTPAEMSFVSATSSAQANRFCRIYSSGGTWRDFFGNRLPLEAGSSVAVMLRVFISTDAAGWIAPTIHVPMQDWFTPAPRTYAAWIDNSGHPIIPLDGSTVARGTWQTFTGTFTKTAAGEAWIQTRIRYALTSGYVEFALELVRATDASLVVDGAITARKIASGSITTELLAVGTSGTNLSIYGKPEILSSPTSAGLGPVANMTGWGKGWNNFNGDGTLFLQNGGIHDIQWSPSDGACIVMHCNLTSISSGYVWDTAIGLNDRITCTPGMRVEASIRLQNHRCSSQIKIAWYDRLGNYITEIGGESVGECAISNAPVSSWTRLGIFGVAPTGAAYMLPYVRHSGIGQSYAYTFMCNLFVGPAQPNQTVFTNWMPAGSATIIDGSRIKTGTLDAKTINSDTLNVLQGTIRNLVSEDIKTVGLSALSANLGTVTAGDLTIGKFKCNGNEVAIGSNSGGAGLRITGDVIEVRDENGALRVRLGKLA